MLYLNYGRIHMSLEVIQYILRYVHTHPRFTVDGSVSTQLSEGWERDTRINWSVMSYLMGTATSREKHVFTGALPPCA